MAADIALDSRVLIDDEFDLAIQEIDLVLNTNNTELIGDVDYGVNLETFLWTLSPTTSDLNNYITSKIKAYCPLSNKYQVNVNTQYYKGSYRSIYVITISLTNENGVTFTRKYQYK